MNKHDEIPMGVFFLALILEEAAGFIFNSKWFIK